MIYPWQHTQWQQLIQRKDRMPHALLLLGIRGIGKLHFAECFVRTQLCQTGKDACDCHSCRLITGRTHPNVLWITPEKPGVAIKVDQIRDVAEFIHQTSLQGEYRFVLIHPAASMNINAANALLKTLEEPAPASMLILIAEQASQMPATIVSRCQHLHFPRPQTDLALKWLSEKSESGTTADLVLRLVHGAPLAALQFMQDDLLSSRMNFLQSLEALARGEMSPLKMADDFREMEMQLLLDILFAVVMDLLRLQVSGHDSSIINQDFLPQLKALQQRMSSEKITRYMSFLLIMRGQQQEGINLNKQLMAENLFIRWKECA